LFLRQFTCAAVGEENFDNIKMHGMYVKKKKEYVSECNAVPVDCFIPCARYTG